LAGLWICSFCFNFCKWQNKPMITPSQNFKILAISNLWTNCILKLSARGVRKANTS
jgi:hypothetical protein